MNLQYYELHVKIQDNVLVKDKRKDVKGTLSNEFCSESLQYFITGGLVIVVD